MIVKMNPEAKAIWLAALRSGNYAQGMGRLRSGFNRFCCLGVLAEEHAKIDPVHVQACKTSGDWMYNDSVSTLPEATVRWAFPEADIDKFDGSPAVIFQEQQKELGIINDDFGLPFPQIADLIEAQL